MDQTIPVNAVVSGRDLDGSVIYVGKAKFESDKLPAKIIPERRYASVSHNGREHSVKTYKVIINHCCIAVNTSFILVRCRFCVNMVLGGLKARTEMYQRELCKVERRRMEKHCTLEGRTFKEL